MTTILHWMRDSTTETPSLTLRCICREVGRAHPTGLYTAHKERRHRGAPWRHCLSMEDIAERLWKAPGVITEDDTVDLAAVDRPGIIDEEHRAIKVPLPPDGSDDDTMVGR